MALSKLLTWTPLPMQVLMQPTALRQPQRGNIKSVPLYNKAKAVHYGTEGVYMNHTPGGAPPFRGYGATEALWPLECAVNRLADEWESTQQNFVKRI